jgi:lipopolysaccharide export LptBFGC system permease protein LptF
MLASTSIVYGRMDYDKEILILRAAGIHFHKIFRPAFLLGIILSCVCLYINGDIVPITMLKQREVRYKALETILSVTFSSEETTIDFIPDLRIYYGKLESGQFQHLVIQHITQAQVTEEILAERGHLVYDKDKKILTFHLQQGSMHYITRKQGVPASSPLGAVKEERFFFEQISLPITLVQQEDSLNREQDKFKGMARLFHDMKRYQKEFEDVSARRAAIKADPQASPAAVQAVESEYLQKEDIYVDHQMGWHQRIATSLVSFLVVLIGAPLGMVVRHDNRLVAFGVGAIPVLLVYYPLQLCGETLGNKYILSPWLANWLSNLVTSAIGIVLLGWVYKK